MGRISVHLDEKTKDILIKRADKESRSISQLAALLLKTTLEKTNG